MTGELRAVLGEHLAPILECAAQLGVGEAEVAVWAEASHSDRSPAAFRAWAERLIETRRRLAALYEQDAERQLCAGCWSALVPRQAAGDGRCVACAGGDKAKTAGAA